MRRLLPILVVLLVAALPDMASACGARKGRTVVQNAKVRVYHTGPLHERSYYACLKPRGRRLDLAFAAPYPSAAGYPEEVRLAGRFVAYGQGWFDTHFEVTDYSVHVVDVRRRRHRWPMWEFSQLHYAYSLHIGGLMRLWDLRVKRNGSAAFQIGPVATGDSEAYEVWVADSRGRRRVESSQDVDPLSFRATRRTVSWTRGGTDLRVPFR